MVESALIALQRSVPDWSQWCTLAEAPGVLDLLWDADLSVPEIEASRCIQVDSRKDARRVIIQVTRGEIRYWLTTNREPGDHASPVLLEHGILATMDDAGRLCREFLAVGLKPDELRVRRRAFVAGRGLVETSAVP